MAQVTKEEFDAFVKEYPSLNYDFSIIPDPPMTIVSVPSNGKIVSKIIHEYVGPDGKRVGPECKDFWKYEIMDS